MQARDSARRVLTTSFPSRKVLKILFAFNNAFLVVIFSSSFSFEQSLKLEIKELNATELKAFSDEIYAGHEYHNDFVCWTAMGQALSIAHQYEESNTWFEKAFLFKMDQKSPGDSRKEESYDDVHEVSMVLYYKTLNYLQLGDLENALVECRRLNEWMQPRNSSDFARKLVSEDPLIQSLQGFVYEMENDYSDSYISYNNAEHLLSVAYKNLFSKQVPDQIRKSVREMKSLTEVSKINLGINHHRPYGQLLFVWHNGQSPQKLITCPDYKIKSDEGNLRSNNEVAEPFTDCLGNTLLPFYKFSLPNYISGELIHDSNKVPCELLEDVTWFSVYTLQERLQRNGIHVWRHGVNWSTFPSTIYYSIITLTPGINKFNFTMRESSGASRIESFIVDGDGMTHTHVITTLDCKPLSVMKSTLNSMLISHN